MAKKAKPNRDIREAEKALKDIMQVELSIIAEKLVKDLMRKYEAATPSQQVNAYKQVKATGIQNYKDNLLKAVSELALDSMEKAAKDVPKTKKKLAIPVEFKKLPPELQRKIRAQLDLTVDDQINNLEKNIYFQYGDSYSSTDSSALIEEDLNDAAEDYIRGAAIRGGASAVASKVVNEARSAFFFQDDTLDEVQAFRFVNPMDDRTSPICADLHDTEFTADDPNFFRYTPPLHFGCRSYIEPVYNDEKLKKGITKLKPSKEKLEKYIQFSE